MPQDTAAVDRAVRNAHCVVADSAMALVTADVLSRDLRRGCPVVVDLTGYTYDVDRSQLRAGSTPSARRHDDRWQAKVRRYFGSADAVLLVRLRADGLSRLTVRRLLARARVVGTPPYEVLVARPAR